MNQPKPESIQRPEAKPPFQFGLKSLFVVTFVCAILCATGLCFGMHGVILGIALVLVVVAFRYRQARPMAAVVAAFLLLVAFFLPGVGGPRAAKRAECMNNLKQIALALHNYHSVYDCFPPAYIADESGKPMHSWRVLLLPFLEQQVLYTEYDFDEPWNGPNNSKLLDVPVSAFRCPSDNGDDEGEALTTSYVAVRGPDTAWSGEKPAKFGDFGDGIANTIRVVEVKDSSIHWMGPRDLHVVQMAPEINAKAGQGISSNHPGGAIVVFADGHTRFLSEDLSPETIRALLTRNGGEKVDADEF